MPKNDAEIPEVTDLPPAPVDAFEILPADPVGWAIPLTDNGRWKPSPLGPREVDLGTFDTKAEGVAAIDAYDHPDAES